MSEFTPLREAVDTLAGRRPSPDFGELKRRATRRGRRRLALVAAATAAMIAGSAAVVASLDDDRRTSPIEQPKLGPATNGWVAVDGDRDGGDIYLVRPGEDARRLEVAGPGAADDSCAAWSPDGTRLLFGRLIGSSGTASNSAELVIVPVGSDGAVGAETRIELDGFNVLPGFDAHPCGIWAPDGRWVAFAGTGEVWVVDTQTGAIRRLPDLRPSDLEWRPGTDELAIAGDMGADRGAPTLSTPVTVYSVSTGELSHLGAVDAAFITWSPDGTSLAYTGGESDLPQLWLVDSQGGDQRLLVADLGGANHGVGPVWSPDGDRIAYQRVISGERHEVVLVSVADGTETVIKPPRTKGSDELRWYPDAISWSPDGTTLLYQAWSEAAPGRAAPSGVIAVPADAPSDVTVLINGFGPAPFNYSHRWAPIQVWGRQPEPTPVHAASAVRYDSTLGGGAA